MLTREQKLAEVTKKYEAAYKKRTLRSRDTQESARKYMPGGDTRTAIWYEPYPLWIDKGEGCRFADVDGHEYIDFNNNMTAMILGHANPKVVAAVREQAAKGSSFGALIPKVVRWAELICNMVPSVDKVRFTNSGTEAVMMAIRLARGLTGKDLLLKTEGCYHGSYDPIVSPSDATGISKSNQADSVVVPYNDKKAAEKAIAENKDKLAAVIIEGAIGGFMIPPRDGYLEFLRKITQENSVLFILDEVISLRLAWGGMAAWAKVKPDLTTMAKIIGGGYPVGAIGGREDLMQMFSPDVHKVHHSGTLNANPMTATAGAATLEQLNAGVIDKINKLGESFANGVRAVFKKLGIKGQLTGMGSLQAIHFTDKVLMDWKSSTREVNKDLQHLFHLAMLERGIFTAARGLWVMSTPMTQREIDTAVKAVDDVLTELKPTIGELWPDLVG